MFGYLALIPRVAGRLWIPDFHGPLSQDAPLLTVHEVSGGNHEQRAAAEGPHRKSVVVEQEVVSRPGARVARDVHEVPLVEENPLNGLTQRVLGLESATVAGVDAGDRANQIGAD